MNLTLAVLIPLFVVAIWVIAEVSFRRAKFKLERDFKIETERIAELEKSIFKKLD